MATKTIAPPTADPQEICRTLEVLFRRGDVVELRAFGDRRCVISGYFDDHYELTRHAVEINGLVEAVYVTLNEINPDLFARRANRVEEFAKSSTTIDIPTSRHWSLVICVYPSMPG